MEVRNRISRHLLGYENDPVIIGTPNPQIFQEARSSKQLLKDTEQLSRLEDDIRKIPAYSNFLKPLEEVDYVELVQNGPIVTFNVGLHVWRCNALLITRAGIDTIKLPSLNYTLAIQLASELVGNDPLSQHPPST